MKHALLLLFPAMMWADTYPRQPQVDAVHYAFRLTLSDESDEIVGEATADIRFVQDGVREFALDLASAAGGKGMTVSEVRSGQAAVQFKHEANRLVVSGFPAARAGERQRFVVRYRGVPASGLYISKNKYGERIFFSINWPDLARQWLPIIDHPYDKATSEFLITAPAKYQVVANGLMLERTDAAGGMRMTHWKQSVPIASWLNAIGVAQFASRHFGYAAGVPLETWVFHQDRDNGIVTFETPTRQAMEFFSTHIGPYPYEKLADVQAQAPGFGGGTEHASAIFYGDRTVTDRPATNLVTHEIAHQWFGDSVTEKDWDDVWLSEGFATYFTLLATEHYQGRDAFVEGLKRSRTTVFRTEAANPGVAVQHKNLADMRRVLNQLVYQKGGWVLHMLCGEIGTTSFWSGIREYYRRYRDSNASSADFRRVMEEVSGADLGWFFDQWLTRAGSPAVSGSWTYDAKAGKLAITLEQKTEGGVPYRLPLEVGISVEGAPVRMERVDFSTRQQRFEFAAPKKPTGVTLDPDTRMLIRLETFGEGAA